MNWVKGGNTDRGEKMLVRQRNLRSRVLFCQSMADSRESGDVPRITSVIEILERDVSKVSEKACISA